MKLAITRQTIGNVFANWRTRKSVRAVGWRRRVDIVICFGPTTIRAESHTSTLSIGTASIEAPANCGGVEAEDWEDMCSFVLDSKPYLLLADVGDNGTRRKEVQVHFIAEPLDPKEDLRPEHSWRIQYDNGPQNCEAIAIDVPGRTILLVSKQAAAQSDLYSVPLHWKDRQPIRKATRIGSVDLPFVTAMDISADGHQAVIMSYHAAKLYRREAKESWPAALRRPAIRIELPRLRQAEAICFSRDGRTLYISSEKRPTPFWKLSLRDL